MKIQARLQQEEAACPGQDQRPCLGTWDGGAVSNLNVHSMVGKKKLILTNAHSTMSFNCTGK